MKKTYCESRKANVKAGNELILLEINLYHEEAAHEEQQKAIRRKLFYEL